MVHSVLLSGHANCAGDEVNIILDQTPFYAESGGQVGDQGFLKAVAPAEGSLATSSSSLDCEALVSDVQKIAGDFFAHRARITAGDVAVGQQVQHLDVPQATLLVYTLHLKTSGMNPCLARFVTGMIGAPEPLKALCIPRMKGIVHIPVLTERLCVMHICTCVHEVVSSRYKLVPFVPESVVWLAAGGFVGGCS